MSEEEVRSPNGEQVSTHLGASSRITGKLSFEGSVLIEGHVEGQIETQESILIGESAIVNADLRANSVVISGRVTGEVISRRRVEIRARGQLCGEVTTPSLIVHEGALFDGRCSVSGCPVSQKEEARSPTPHHNGTEANHDDLKVKSEVEW